MEEGLIKDAADFFELKEGDIIQLERFAEKSTENLIESIQNSRRVSLSRFIYALGIRNVGQETAQRLADYFSNIGKLSKAKPEDFLNIKDIGPVVSKSISDWFSDAKNKALLARLEKLVIIKNRKKEIVSQKFKGLIFALKHLSFL